MDKRKKFGMAVLIISMAVKVFTPTLTAGSSPSDGNLNFTGADPALTGRFDAVLLLSIQMVDAAMATLQNGWQGMSADERAQFSRFFDPGNTGEVDEAFIAEVLRNYKKIRGALDQEIDLVYKPESEQCVGMRLYYTDFLKIFVCPYIYQENRDERLARDLVHEMAHISLLATDRAYYSASDARYAALTPEGHWSAGLPVVGKILRELVRADTLYNPDAYSHYAWAMAAASP